MPYGTEKTIRDYLDILEYDWQGSPTRPHMGMTERAAQFSPFAALTGYGDMVREEARLTLRRPEMDPVQLEEMDRRIRCLADHLGERCEAVFTVFQPDAHKQGGSWETVTGIPKRIDPLQQCIVLEGGRCLPMADLGNIESDLFRVFSAEQEEYGKEMIP